MKLIQKQADLFDLIKKEKVKIRDSQIAKICISSLNNEALIEVDLLHSNRDVIRLRFSKIKEYWFYHSSRYIFYNVESFKLIRSGGLFFISFDPEDEGSLEMSENDQDSILFEDFEAYYLDTNQS